MSTDFIEELRWRGLLQDITPNTEKLLQHTKIKGYIGFDPTADSLHVGNLVPIILLKHFQRHGHKPVALVGGSTGMIGDPSGKSKERVLLSEDTLSHNLSKIKAQLTRFISFDDSASGAVLVNNYDWMKSVSFIDFVRHVGRHITVNYMLSKQSVKKRIEGEGMSFTEFTYQLFQGYDFLRLYEDSGCVLQMGGSDQWGNITTGVELIRRMNGGEAHALTCPLITKADGTKFGKSEAGNVWLSAEKTSPYKFYQFWLNLDDQDAENYIKIFTFLTKDEVAALTASHREAPHLRRLQKAIAEELTRVIHSEKDLKNAQKASDILFGNATKTDLEALDESLLAEVFEGVPTVDIPRSDIEAGLDIVSALSSKTAFMNSNSEARRALKENAVQLNKQKVTEAHLITPSDIVAGRYVLLQKGKKTFYLINIT